MHSHSGIYPIIVNQTSNPDITIDKYVLRAEDTVKYLFKKKLNTELQYGPKTYYNITFPFLSLIYLFICLYIYCYFTSDIFFIKKPYLLSDNNRFQTNQASGRC